MCISILCIDILKYYSGECSSNHRYIHVGVFICKQDISPLKVFHIGGDEVPGDALSKSPLCKRFVEQNKMELQAHVLKVHFVRNIIASLFSKLGVEVQAWEEGLGGDGHNDPPIIKTWNHCCKLTINAWNYGKLLPFTFANAGYQVDYFVDC